MASSQDRWKTEAIRPDDPRPAHAAVQQLMQLAESTGSRQPLLWASVCDQGKLGAGILIIPQPGQNGMVFTSPPNGREGVARLAKLIHDGCLSVDLNQIQMVQVLVEPSQKRIRQAFEQAGFWRLARLSYLQAAIPHRPEPPTLPAGGQLIRYDEAHKALFIEALESSYRGTMDCPKLHGLRQTAQAIAAHRGTGRFDPNLWSVLKIKDRIAGVILLNRIVSVQAVELVYLGLSPQDRGHGLGAALLQHGIAQAAATGNHTMVLAVDEANTPAVRLYKRFRFTQTDIKDAFVRHLPTSTGG